MGDQKHSCPLICDLTEMGQHPQGRFHVKPRRRFICDHQLGLFHHRCSDQHPPCHSAGKFKRIHMIHFFIKAIPGQCLPAFFQTDPFFPACYLLSHFHQWVQIRNTLGNQDDLMAPQLFDPL